MYKEFKEYKVTGPEKPMKFLVIIMYEKESIRLMKFKLNSYLIKKPCTKKCTRLYKNYVLRAHCILCLWYVKRYTLQYIKRALLKVLSNQN
ncbi:hypothetical protein COM25_25930 [Bacillus wiedmannii]|uniref:Uncharacterized protein n=1 Tax=Bacillus wiedmannii TaxID=1890302 RepID=A0ABD6TG90_9BACI|nr:hypothetical protein DN394_06090 [Bacillus sp. BB081]PEO57087.1 hypothetical protein CN560_16660 [Bacillus wiedmannii]PEO69629.1 hypothetical protein CN572_23895 [Bacillus wiedmannii]PGC71974.1 hypothetical protein COM25_25930 [Bacillus wiedmannii]PHG13419.1 hypothetical protein COI74_29110 [Bacillus wiedmannii]